MILIISDYHHQESKVLDLINKYHPDRILCLGDTESEISFIENNNITSVKGNCDYIDLPKVRTVTIKGINIVMTHGHEYSVINGLNRLYYLAKEKQATFAFYGHTHIQKMETYDGITFLNPGSVLEDNYALMDDNFNITLF